jgi:hypothetical protein
MSTQNAKRMTIWIGLRYMGHSHGQPFRQDTALLIGLNLPMGSRTRSRSASAKAAAIVRNSFEWRSAEICSRVLSALDGFDMAKPYPLSTLPRNAHIRSRLIVSPKT